MADKNARCIGVDDAKITTQKEKVATHQCQSYLLDHDACVFALKISSGMFDGY